MSLLGAGFNESQPSESDLVKKGAAQLRDIKSRLKAWATVLFNLDTGDFKDAVVRQAALVDGNPDPSGTFTSVSVNKKGLVTAGTNPEISANARIHRWTYFFTEGRNPDGDAVAKTGALDTDLNTVAQYTFLFPAGVTRIFVKVQGGGGGSSAAEGGGGGGGYCEATIDGAEGDAWLIWVGEGVEDGLGTPHHSGNSKFEFSALKYLRGDGGFSATGAPGATGGAYDTAGIAGAFGITGGAGSTEVGGPAGCGAPSSTGALTGGYGAMPTAGAGADGFVIVEYWKT